MLFQVRLNSQSKMDSLKPKHFRHFDQSLGQPLRQVKIYSLYIEYINTLMDSLNTEGKEASFVGLSGLFPTPVGVPSQKRRYPSFFTNVIQLIKLISTTKTMRMTLALTTYITSHMQSENRHLALSTYLPNILQILDRKS